MIPTLDISSFLESPQGADTQEFVRRLRESCRNPGFFYLVGHGVPEQADREMIIAARRFFALPDSERQAIAIGNSPHFRGYTILGDEMTAGKNDWREQLDVGPEEPALFLGPEDPVWLRLRGPNQWPEKLPEMRETVVSWMANMEPVALALIRALAIGLGQTAHYFDKTMTPDPYTRVKIVRYPATPAGMENNQGLGLHHDSGLFTFILQDTVPGLQVEIDGELVDVKPVQGAYVVNLGEMFQVASNGYLRATPHQVVSPPPGKERISIAYFMNPRLDAVFETIDLPAELACQTTGAQNADPRDVVYRTFGDNTLKTRMRAHPDVVENFYQDCIGRSHTSSS